jgi:hypothetical protein
LLEGKAQYSASNLGAVHKSKRSEPSGLGKADESYEIFEWHQGTYNMVGDFFYKAIARQNVPKISEQNRWTLTYQDTHETGVTSHKTKNNLKNKRSQTVARERTLVGTGAHKEMRRQPKRLNIDNKPKGKWIKMMKTKGILLIRIHLMKSLPKMRKYRS